MNNFIITTFAKAHAAAVSQKGADSVEWFGVAAVLIAGIIIAFLAVTGGLEDVANTVVNKIKGATN